MLSAIILAGGESNRMKKDKGLSLLCDTPLIEHVTKKVSDLVDEVVLIVKNDAQRRRYILALGPNIKIKKDLIKISSPIIGAITGLSNTKAEYALIVACDMPFVSKQAILMLFKKAEGHNGAVFQHPNGWIEPLCAVYKVEPSLKIALNLLKKNDLRIRMILKNMEDVVNIPIDTLKEIDPTLLTFFDADTEDAIKEAQELIRKNI